MYIARQLLILTVHQHIINIAPQWCMSTTQWLPYVYRSKVLHVPSCSYHTKVLHVPPFCCITVNHSCPPTSLSNPRTKQGSFLETCVCVCVYNVMCTQHMCTQWSYKWVHNIMHASEQSVNVTRKQVHHVPSLAGEIIVFDFPRSVERAPFTSACSTMWRTNRRTVEQFVYTNDIVHADAINAYDCNSVLHSGNEHLFSLLPLSFVSWLVVAA